MLSKIVKRKKRKNSTNNRSRTYCNKISKYVNKTSGGKVCETRFIYR